MASARVNARQLTTASPAATEEARSEIRAFDVLHR